MFSYRPRTRTCALVAVASALFSTAVRAEPPVPGGGPPAPAPTGAPAPVTGPALPSRSGPALPLGALAPSAAAIATSARRPTLPLAQQHPVGKTKPTVAAPVEVEKQVLLKANLASASDAQKTSFLEQRFRENFGGPPAKFSNLQVSRRTVGSRLAPRLLGERGRAISFFQAQRPNLQFNAGQLGSSPLVLRNQSATTNPALGNNAPAVTDFFIGDQHVRAEVAGGETITLIGSNFLAGGTPIVLAEFGQCGTVQMPIVIATDDHILATIPHQLVNNWQVPLRVVVQSGNVSSTPLPLTYDSDIDLVNASVDVGYKPGANGGHAMSDAGIGLVEGQTMMTSTGDTRASCCTIGGRGGDNVDTYFPRVKMANNWKTVDWLSVDGKCIQPGGGFAGMIASGSCRIQFLQTPTAASSNIYFDSGSADGASNFNLFDHLGTQYESDSPETVVEWTYGAGSGIDYTVGWSFAGPHGSNPFSWMSGTAPCSVPIHQ